MTPASSSVAAIFQGSIEAGVTSAPAYKEGFQRFIQPAIMGGIYALPKPKKYVHKTLDKNGENPVWWLSDYPGWAEDEVYDGDEEHDLMVERYGRDYELVYQTDEEYDAATDEQSADPARFYFKYGYTMMNCRPIQESFKPL